ncbi:acetate--CoA ligase family protein [Fodinicola acaciae]|uniref:acetate--CoA ligase family protein n=1 Tax=Fodinicola acaciae TaxID=2681555 RepID=UPI0013D36CF8|nr:acetate--CoA ligase family protein [Fodinicola acaciae]
MSDLTVFRDPASVAVVGASADPAKWGHWLAAGALKGAHRRRVDLVNRGGATIFGRASVRRLSDLNAVPELVALCVPDIEDVVEEALRLGVRGFVGITAGVAGEAGLVDRIRAAGARIVGPNSLGLYDADSALQLAWGNFTPGPLAIVSQSGQLGSEIAALAARHGLGVSRFVSVGSQADVTATELLADLAGHRGTRIVALYLESFTGGELLLDTLATLDKPVMLLTVGASAASSRLARSHTGALTSSMDVVDAACRAAGVLRVRTPAQLVTVARACLATKRPAGRRVAIIADSGGQAGIAADLAADRLAIPPLPRQTRESLRLPAGAATANPIDLAGAGERDLGTYADTVERALSNVDAAILTGYFGSYGTDTQTLAERESDEARRLGKVVRNSGKPVIVHSMTADSATAAELWNVGVPTYPTIEEAVDALAGLAAFQPTKPAPKATARRAEIGPGYWRARQFLSGVRFPRARLIRSERDLQTVAGLAPPYVLKAGWLDHKTEVGGVRTNLDTVFEAYAQMRERLGPGDYLVEEQDTREDVVEMLIGMRRDPDFGPVAVIGAGGAAAEMHRDTAVELAPVTVDTAMQMIGRLRIAALLRGWRGRPAKDVAALAGLVADLSRLFQAYENLAELELNPVRVGVDGVLAVDALLVPKGEA